MSEEIGLKAVPEVLSLISPVLAGLIAGLILGKISTRNRLAIGLLEERLGKTDEGLAQFSHQLEMQNKEIKQQQLQLQGARETAAVSRAQLEAVTRERNDLKSAQSDTTAALEKIRIEKEALAKQVTEAAEKLRSQESQTKFLEKARADLIIQFRSLSGQMLDGSRDALLKTTKETVSEPFAKQMEQLHQQMQVLQRDSVEKLGILAQTTLDLRQRSEDVQGAAQQLTSALRSPNVKGRWGEVNLRRILEFVGLISYCDFDEQVHIGTEDGAYRPDCVVTIPGSRRLIVDSKAPIESYLDALRADDEAQKEVALREHLKKVRSHIDLLSKKDYAGKLGSLGQVVDAVILFIPVEGALSMALERDPNLLEYAFSRKIILTFPTSLLAILKGLAMSIQQAEVANNIEEIQDNAVELYKRFLTFVDKFNAVGSNLARLNKSFNEAVGSAQGRLLPQGRRFAELASQSSENKISDTIDSIVRRVQTED
ncbi:DNA recombination protein RmuC [cyanobiont of Ornithocercus magnificus]|nr:DNA recombination protein RmuC [cyanobiont of Ornithocercus magnificus]